MAGGDLKRTQEPGASVRSEFGFAGGYSGLGDRAPRPVLRPLRVVFALLFVVFGSGAAFSQQLGVKTNLLYWATTTPNVGLEVRVSPRYTLSASFGYNAFNFPNRSSAGSSAVNPKLHHWVVKPEVKHWFCRSFERHYLGVHALYGHYNVGGLGFPKFLDGVRYKGWAAGGGLSYGYQWALGRRWGLEASVGAGYLYLRYDKYNCGACGRKLGRYRRHYFGPTEASVSIIYYIR